MSTPPSAYSVRKQLLKPVNDRFVLFSLLLALVLNLMPWNNRPIQWAPDFMALFLIYWTIHHTVRVGIGVAFVCGLVMDIANATVFGQHSLAYVVMAYLTLLLHRRLRMFNRIQQSLHVFGILLSLQLVMVATRMVTGAAWPGWGYLVAAATGTLLWPLVAALLQIPQRQAEDDGA